MIIIKCTRKVIMHASIRSFTNDKLIYRECSLFMWVRLWELNWNDTYVGRPIYVLYVRSGKGARWDGDR